MRSLRQVRSKGLGIRPKQQILLVAAIAVGFVITPAHAYAPVMTAKEKRAFVVSQMEPKTYARHLIAQQWRDPKKQFGCLAKLWGKESAWNHKAKSPTHDYGIPQRHMSHNTPEQIKGFLKDPQGQIRWGLNYIQTRYESPCGALQSWLSRADENGRGGWY